MEHPGAVSIVPVTPEGDIILIRQYRHTVKDWCWEIPMGARGEEDSELTALRELKEEIGGTCQEIKHIGYFYGNIGVSNIRCDTYLARDVILGESHPEIAELIYLEILSRKKVMHMARTAKISDGFSALSLLLCESHLD
jgi:ADP-ribose pyrophosphatase